MKPPVLFVTKVMHKKELIDYHQVSTTQSALELDGSLFIQVGNTIVADNIETTSINSLWCLLLQRRANPKHGSGFNVFIPGTSAKLIFDVNPQLRIARVGCMWKHSAHAETDLETLVQSMTSCGSDFLNWLIKYSPKKNPNLCMIMH